MPQGTYNNPRAGSTASMKRIKKLTDKLKRVEEGTGNKARMQQLESQIGSAEKKAAKQQIKAEKRTKRSELSDTYGKKVARQKVRAEYGKAGERAEARTKKSENKSKTAVGKPFTSKMMAKEEKQAARKERIREQNYG